MFVCELNVNPVKGVVRLYKFKCKKKNMKNDISPQNTHNKCFP